MKIETLEVFGNDLTVVNAARVSFNKQKEIFDEKDEKLIKYLIKHNHWTPFAHPQIRLRITAPIFIAREWYRHTIGVSRNEVSRRYVTNEPEFWYPDYFRVRDSNLKQGSLDVEAENSEYFKDKYNKLINECRKLYLEMIESNIAPEQARAILPQSMYTSWIETGSLYFYIRLLKLRLDKNAQKEIRVLASNLNNILEIYFPITMKAFKENG